MLDGMSLDDSVDEFKKQIKSLNTEIQGQREDITNIDNQKRSIQIKQSSGISISKSEQDFLNRTKELKALSEAEMKNLNNQIQNLSQEKNKYRKAAATEKGVFGMGGDTAVMF